MNITTTEKVEEMKAITVTEETEASECTTEPVEEVVAAAGADTEEVQVKHTDIIVVVVHAKRTAAK